MPATIALFLLMLAAPVALAPADIRSAVAFSGRPAPYIALDEHRRPVDILSFLGLKRGDDVLDYEAGGGYYAEIIGRAVGPEGSVVAWHRPFFFAQERVTTSFDNIKKRTANVTSVSSPLETLSFPKDKFDLVMVHMSYHDAYWQSDEYGFPRMDPAIVTRALFEATKPGGVLGVVEHAANPGRDVRAEVESTHRILPQIVRADFEAAGFQLEAESDLLRNPSDDRTKSVFAPDRRNRTDRIVYRFRKPKA